MSKKRSTWAPIDNLADIVDQVANGIDGRIVPDLLVRDDGAGLFYRGMVNGVHGEPGSGKTWLALLACAQELNHGRHVIYVDHEDSPRRMVSRLLDLGVTADLIAYQFHYVRPGETFADGGTALLETVHDTDASLVVIDSTGRGLALHGANPNADEDVIGWFSEVPRRIADLGPAVVLLDHVPKAGRDGLWPIGSQRKLASIDGTQVYMETLRPFSQKKAGAARLMCAKDREGHYTLGEVVGILNVTPNGDGTSRMSLEAPTIEEPAADGGFRPTTLMERVSEVLEAESDLTTNAIVERVTGKRSGILRAVSVLIDEGYVTTTSGSHRSTLHRSAIPFRRERFVGSSSVPPLRGGGTGNHSTDWFPGTTGNHSGTGNHLESER